MFETKLRLIEDRPDRITFAESIQPWQWGGLEFTAAQIFLFLLFPFLLIVKGNRKIIFDRAFQNITIKSRILFSQKQNRFQFSDIEHIQLMPRELTRVVGGTSPNRQGTGGIAMPVALRLGELYLSLSNASRLKIITSYWNDNEVRNLGNKISRLTGKTFIEDPNINSTPQRL